MRVLNEPDATARGAMMRRHRRREIFGDNFLKINVLYVFFAVFCGVGIGYARQPPSPPPSGIVVHLFGPGSISSNLLPSGDAASGGTASPASSGSSYVEPSTSDILHQMFVTGAPNQQPGQALSKGRAGN